MTAEGRVKPTSRDIIVGELVSAC